MEQKAYKLRPGSAIILNNLKLVLCHEGGLMKKIRLVISLAGAIFILRSISYKVIKESDL
jgi:hypothetical protein